MKSTGILSFLTLVNFRSVNEMPHGNITSHVEFILQYVYSEWPILDAHDIIFSYESNDSVWMYLEIMISV